MKDNLFEMLLNLFEKTLTQLKESHTSKNDQSQEPSAEAQNASATEHNVEFIKDVSSHAIRVFTEAEQLKLTKASYQFLMRIASWGVIAPDMLELIINQLTFSESRFVSLQETKWAIRNTLANSLNAEQLAFLDLVLYHKEDELPLH